MPGVCLKSGNTGTCEHNDFFFFYCSNVFFLPALDVCALKVILHQTGFKGPGLLMLII